MESIEKKKQKISDTKNTEKTGHTLVGHMSKEPRLKGKIAIVSGASRGFGQAIAIRFVEEGARVVCCSRSGCEETLRLIGTIEGLSEPKERVALSAKCDISAESSVMALYEAVKKWSGEKHVDILINNAACFVFKSIEDASVSDWEWTCRVNIIGSALMTKHAIPLLKQSPAPHGTSIVFQGSISSFLAQPNCCTYSMTKAAIVQMARNAAYDLAKYRIRVNSVCAGTVETPISAVERKEHGWSFEEWERLKVKDVMLRRVGHVREVANATLFYASDESTYCTGGHLMVDGGQTSCTVMD